jgi:hypothetical protein
VSVEDEADHEGRESEGSRCEHRHGAWRRDALDDVCRRYGRRSRVFCFHYLVVDMIPFRSPDTALYSRAAFEIEEEVAHGADIKLIRS